MKYIHRACVYTGIHSNLKDQPESKRKKTSLQQLEHRARCLQILLTATDAVASPWQRLKQDVLEARGAKKMPQSFHHDGAPRREEEEELSLPPAERKHYYFEP